MKTIPKQARCACFR